MSQPSFTDQVFRFILHDPSSLHYFLLLEAEYFIDAMQQAFYDALRQYYNHYQTLPIYHSSFAEYLTQGLANAGQVQKDAVANMVAYAKPYFTVDKYDSPPIIASIIKFAERQELKLLIQDGAKQLNAGDKIEVDDLEVRLTRIRNLKDTMQAVSGDAKEHFALKGMYAMEKVKQEIIPCCFPSINAFRPLGGNAVGEHYVFLSGTKAYKTMFAVNMAVGYLKQGYSVYYVDTENTRRAILQRVRQALGQFTVSELYDGDGKECLQDVADRILSTTGADIYAEEFGTNALFETIEARLDFLKRFYNFTPKVIIYDDMDHITYKDAYKQSKTPYASSGVLINMATTLNRKLGAISWQLAQINKEANHRDDWDETDVGTSFHKIKIAHGVLGGYRLNTPPPTDYHKSISPTDQGPEIVKVVVLVQREGPPKHKLEPAYFIVEPEKQLFKPYDGYIEPVQESKNKRRR